MWNFVENFLILQLLLLDIIVWDEDQIDLVNSDHAYNEMKLMCWKEKQNKIDPIFYGADSVMLGKI